MSRRLPVRRPSRHPLPRLRGLRPPPSHRWEDKWRSTSRSISTPQEFTRRSEDLGEEVAQADREIDQHLHQVFDHRVSQLELVPGEAAAPPAATFETSETTEAAPVASLPVAVGLLDLIGSPESLRQAIILNEILQRPEHRWG